MTTPEYSIEKPLKAGGSYVIECNRMRYHFRFKGEWRYLQADVDYTGCGTTLLLRKQLRHKGRRLKPYKIDQAQGPAEAPGRTYIPKRP